MKIVSALLLTAFLSYGFAADRVSITSPANGTTVTSPLTLTASASGSPSTLSVSDNGTVLVQKRSVSSISTVLTLADGAHTLTVTAAYGRSSSVSSSIHITVSEPTSSPSLASQIYDDMTGSNEGHPDGVPLSYDWANGPIMGYGNNFAPQAALEWWGGLFTGPNGNPASNTMVNVRNVSLYVLSKSTGIWTAYTFPFKQISSDTYSANFVTDYGTSVPMTLESDGSFAFTVAAGKVSHFYAPYPRISVNPNDIGGIVALMEARLILKNASGPDDRASASFLLGAGVDPYKSTTSAGVENNKSVGNGKLKYVETNWRSFAMTTMTLAQLTSNPPPINLTGILP